MTEYAEQAHIASIRGGNATHSNMSVTEYLELADNQSKIKSTRGGYDNKYRKLRGIGEYSKRQNKEPQGRQQPEISANDGVADERQGKSDSGEYP